MTSIPQDLRSVLRQIRKAPAFALMVVATMALGIGSTTAVFSLVDTVLLHPLPFSQPDRLVALNTLEQPRGNSGEPATAPSDTSYPNFFDWRDQAKSFQQMASYQGQSFTLGLSNAPARRIDGLGVSADFFTMLRVAPALGRTFTRAEEQAGNRSVIISYSLWRDAFNASPAVLGKAVLLNEETYTIVGVMPASFQFPNAPDAEVWVTPSVAMEGKNPSGKQRGWNQISVLGRLADGVGIDQARAEMQTIQLALVKQYPDDNSKETAVAVVPELQDLVGDLRRPLRILFAAVSFLLLIACANVAGLFLTRTVARQPELALRSALGASRLRIVRQLMLESLSLSLLGGAGGVALTAVVLRLSPNLLPDDLPRLHELSLNPQVLLFALLASILTGLLFTAFPAWRGCRLDPAIGLRHSTRSATAGRSQHRLHSALIIGETAMSLVLLVGAGLLIRSFDKLLSVDPGFSPQHLLTFRVGMPSKRFRDDKLLRLAQQLQSSFSVLPGVRDATFAYPMPLTGGDMNISFTIPTHPTSAAEAPSARVSLVAANFFQSMQIPLRRGRFFDTREEQPDSPPAIIINQAFANRYFPGEDPLGKRVQSDISSSDQPQSREVVGVVGNVTRLSLEESAQPEYYIPFAQVPIGPPVFAIRVAGDPASYDQTVRATVVRQDPSLPVYAMRTNLLARSTAQQRFQTLLISIFATLAILLSALGLYAVTSYMVAQRTLELGLRMTLGARRWDVLRLVLDRGLVLCATGLALGLVASVALSRYLATLLFHTPALDPITFSMTTLLLLAISTLSCLIPAVRAARLDPNQALRQE
ncbi:duplicated orphan permease [Bryocella elongata]|uniref:Duplicated orphan permease n=1 Tax=Bryocella elongata TaxID=863522 RepID=A0A1H5Z302_9BACT|nr:ABC transporter permease [Bryocella elongata]SEG30883.1 duplicated orphan permease [Bryocella elongata]